MNELKQSEQRGIQLSPDLVELFCLLFADDVAIFSDSVIGLQRLLNNLSIYCDKWKMTVNLDKTKIVVFKNGGHLSKHEKWYYKGNRVEVVSHYKYLGVLFSCKLQWSPATEVLSQQAKKAFIIIIKNTKKIWPLTFESFFKIFDSMILPILTYGSEIWGYKKYDSLERVQLMACRYFLGVSNRAPNKCVLGECGRYPIFYYTAKRCVKYWAKLVNMPSTRYPRKCYDMLYAVEQSGIRSKRTWVAEVKDLLCLCNLSEIWDSQNVDDIDELMGMFSSRFKTHLFHDWKSDVCTLSKLDTYREFKNTITPEKYIFEVKIYAHRIALSRFRCSAHCLRIELDRGKLQRDQRICQLCNTNQIENEYHFLLICPFFREFRELYLPYHVYNQPSFSKFINVMKSQNADLLGRLGVYLFHTLKLRREIQDLL